MNPEQAQDRVRDCLQRVCPELRLDQVAADTELLRERIITSFQVIDLILHLEQARNRPIQRSDLQPGCFRDIATIARHFFDPEQVS